MAIALGAARFREAIVGRDSMDRAAMWQGNAGSLYGLNMVYARPIVTTATTTTQAKTTNAVDFVVGGRLFNKAATDNFWTLNGPTVNANSWQKYILCVDDTGAATCVAATPSTASAAGVSFGNVIAAAQAFPRNPWAPLTSILSASRAIFGVLTIQTAAGTFIPGTTAAVTGGAITATFIDGIDPLLMPLMYNENGTLLVGRDI